MTDFISAHLDSSSPPRGHGFSAVNLREQRGDWVADPVPSIPIRMIGLNTIGTTVAGTLSEAQLTQFLEPELRRAERDGVLVIVASHHPSAETVRGVRLRRLLAASPNVILHLVGHGHRNEIVPRPSTPTGGGYWEVQTAALIDWPQQQRLIEIVDRGTGRVDILCTMIDYEAPPGSLVEASRFYSLFGKQDPEALVTGGSPGGREDRNVILPVRVPASIRMRLTTLPARAVTSGTF